MFINLIFLYILIVKGEYNMDQVKIGKFISKCRKKHNLTQMQLAEKLNVTDRTVSKWETGRAMPDSSLMLELCNILKITVNDLLNGEVVTMEVYDEKKEQMLISMVKQKEEKDKELLLLLLLETIIGIFTMIILFGFVFSASFVSMPDWLRIVLIIVGFIIAMIGIMFAIRIEQTAGYYECRKCGHKYVPIFKSVVFAMHFERTRYIKCPHCGKNLGIRK